MTWLLLAVAAHFLNAITYVVDRILLLKSLPNPFVYVFYNGILSIFVLALIPFGFSVPGFFSIAICLATGLFFLAALFFLYKALRDYESTRAIPAVGGFIPIFTLIFSYLFLGERLAWTQLFAFVLLVAGGFMIYLKKIKNIYRAEGFLLGVYAAFFFAVFFVLSKYIYIHQEFFSAFIWARLGSFLGAVCLALIPASRKQIFSFSKVVENKRNVGLAFISSRLMGACSFILLHIAISLGSVSLINALQGVQYVFLLWLVALFSFKWPHLLSEEIHRGVLAQKIISIFLIAGGIILLVI